MANFQLAILPMLISIVFLFCALLFFIWMKKKSKKNKHQIQGQKAASVFGYSLIILGGFSLLISMFFIVTG